METLGLRILHVNHAPGWRGGEQQTLYLLQGLQARGHSPVLAAPKQGVLAQRAQKAGIPVHDIQARGDLSWRARRVLREGAETFDIVHAHTARAHGWVRFAFWGMKNPPPTVVSRRVDFPLKGGWGARWKYQGIDRFVAISQCVAQVMIAGGVPEGIIKVVYSGVHPERMQIPGDSEGLKMELGIQDPEAQLVGFLGALVHHKGPEVLLEACSTLPPYVHLLYAGDGPMRSELENRAQQMGMSSRVHFLGHREDVPRILRSIQVFALPSRTEGLGTSILDAMAAGAPVVAGRAGGIPEIVEHGQSGLLVPPGSPADLREAVGAILGDPVLGNHLREGALRRVGKFTHGAMVEGTLQVYRDLVESKS